jgi:hypothetical protein
MRMETINGNNISVTFRYCPGVTLGYINFGEGVTLTISCNNYCASVHGM